MATTTRWNQIKDIIGAFAFIIAGGMFLREMSDLPASVTMYPATIIYLMFALCLALVAKSIAQMKSGAHGEGAAASGDGATGEPEKFGIPTIFVAVASLIYIVSLPYLGFTISTAIMMVVFMLVLGVRSIPVLILVPVVEIAFLLYVFEHLLTVFLPDAGWLKSALGMM